MRRPRSAIEFGTARQPAINHDRNAIERQGGLRDGGGENDAAPAFGIAPDGRALIGRFDLTVQRKDESAGQAHLSSLAHALDLADAGKEGEDVTRPIAPRDGNRIGHGILDPLMRRTAQPSYLERKGAPFAFDHRGIRCEKAGEPASVDRRGHDEDAQILAQHRLAFQRERKAEIAV